MPPKPSKRKAIKAPAKGKGDPRPTPARTAARAVYDILELRDAIFKLVDRRTLAGMWLEKAAVASVVGALYESLTGAEVKKGLRPNLKSSRFELYQNAVRTYDRGHIGRFPPPGQRAWQALPAELPELTESIANLRMLFPRLRTILGDHGFGSHDETYIVHIRDGSIHVELHTPLRFRDYEARLSASGTPILPNAPSCPGLTITQTFSVEVVMGDWRGADVAADYVNEEDFQELKALRGRWAKWYLSGPFDPRIISLSPHLTGDDEVLNTDIMAFLARRCPGIAYPPIHSFRIPHFTGTMTPVRFKALCQTIGPELRSLIVEGSISRFISNWPTLFGIMDAAFPKLESLHVTNSPYRKKVFEVKHILTGMSNLRMLSFDDVASDHLGHAAYSLAGLGTRHCVYRICDLERRGEVEMFHEIIRQIKCGVSDAERQVHWTRYINSDLYAQSRPMCSIVIGRRKREAAEASAVASEGDGAV